MIQIDMEMPATCYDCPFCYDCMSCTLSNGSEFDFEICDEQRMPYCPLKEAPDTNIGKWISVEDKMPEYNGEYIVHFSASDAVLSAYYFKNQGGFRVETNIVTDNVLHWMPLPEPPKEG